MDIDPAALAESAGNALVESAATDAWALVRAPVVALWQRFLPAKTQEVKEGLDTTRIEILEARDSGDRQTEEDLAAEWRLQLKRLLREAPDAARELKKVLDEVIVPASGAAGQQVGTITMKAKAEGHGRIYQAGRDQHVHEK